MAYTEEDADVSDEFKSQFGRSEPLKKKGGGGERGAVKKKRKTESLP